MSYNSFRENDKRQEQIVANYLDKFYYHSTKFIEVNRTTDKNEQLRGSDITLSIPSKNIYNAIIDEKAQLYYLNGGLPTFALELNYINRAGVRQEGWFTDSSKKTEYYNLLYLTAKHSFKSIDEISCIENILISRKKILDFLLDYNMPIDNLVSMGKRVASSKEFHQYKSNNVPYYFTHSTNLAESPVNLIIRKEVLVKLSSLHDITYHTLEYDHY